MSTPRGPAPYDGRDEGPLEASEVRRRAVGGAALLTARGALILALGVVANVVLARLLDPRDFGLVALGTVLISLASYLAEGGLAASLVRRREDPSHRELQVVSGLQLGVALPVALLFAAAALPFGRDGLVVATMVASMPIVALRAPSNIVLERRLRYREIATVDVVDAVTFYAWALTTVALGMGVWGMATGLVVRALAGTVAMLAIGPVGLLRPRWSWREVRPMLAFGLRFQAANFVSVARDQSVNVMVAAVAGIATLGIWNLAWRVLQVPYMLFAATGRIWYPAMSRLLEAGESPRPAVVRGASTLTVASALILAALAGVAPALPEIVGAEWDDVSATLLWSSVALLVAAPIPIMTTGYLFAADAPGAVVRALALSAVTWFGAAVPLVATIGAPGIGLAWIAGAVVSAALFARELRRRIGPMGLAGSGLPTAVGLAAIAAGWTAASAAGGDVLGAIAGIAAGELVLLGGLALLRRPLVTTTWGLLGDAAGGFTRRDARAAD
jgi:O-antigen/teichoic acid export membrane protein